MNSPAARSPGSQTLPRTPKTPRRLTTRKRHRSPMPSAGKSSDRRCHLDPQSPARDKNRPHHQPAPPVRPSPISGWSAPARSGNRPTQRRGPSPGGGGHGTWTPRSYQETEDDRAVGRRGEEIVLGIERERVKQLGLDPSSVIWTADSVPGADHDIKSVDDDGGDLWVEVKATTGRDGQFSWPAAEFQLAIRARKRYVLYRVYEADTTTPSYRPIRDPIGSFDAGELRLDLDSLKGDVGPMA